MGHKIFNLYTHLHGEQLKPVFGTVCTFNFGADGFGGWGIAKMIKTIKLQLDRGHGAEPLPHPLYCRLCQKRLAAYLVGYGDIGPAVHPLKMPDCIY
jgi:hypothetical protein